MRIKTTRAYRVSVKDGAKRSAGVDRHPVRPFRLANRPFKDRSRGWSGNNRLRLCRSLIEILNPLPCVFTLFSPVAY
jgi:hypothetical protein